MATGRGERYMITYDDRPVSRGPDAITMNIVDFLMDDGREGDRVSLRITSGERLYSMIAEYIDVCRKIHGTVLTRDNFDGLSAELQGSFFGLQAYIRGPGFINDGFLQEQLDLIRKNNVRIFNAMMACVNANSEPVYTPATDEQMEELTEISLAISRHLAHTDG